MLKKNIIKIKNIISTILMLIILIVLNIPIKAMMAGVPPAVPPSGNDKNNYNNTRHDWFEERIRQEKQKEIDEITQRDIEREKEKLKARTKEQDEEELLPLPKNNNDIDNQKNIKVIADVDKDVIQKVPNKSDLTPLKKEIETYIGLGKGFFNWPQLFNLLMCLNLLLDFFLFIYYYFKKFSVIL
ncbi:hypothetical protein [Candidatus Phytoplasma pyri]|uniref:hypothetical protein n=1 Tax=Candidatus Phytoplasma pyri TaxID=47566 RepID=UPI003983AD2F